MVNEKYLMVDYNTANGSLLYKKSLQRKTHALLYGCGREIPLAAKYADDKNAQPS